MPMEDAFRSVDPLGEALHFLRMSGTFYCRSEFTAPWGLELPVMEGWLMFHVLTGGQCWLEVDGLPSQLLHTGELTMVTHGKGHRLVSAPGGPAAGLFDLPREFLGDRFEILRHGGGGVATTMLCGAVRFDDPAAQRLVDLLPAVIRIDASQSPHAEWMQSTLRLIAAEAAEVRPGGETVITRLADIVVIQAIRSWLAQDPAAQTGWLGALRDKQIGRALKLIHRDPGRAWTVATLAAEVAMSRSAFAARFTELVGEPAMQYLVRWRMHAALHCLKEQGAHVGELALRFGYRSEAAFSRAFKRIVGVAPAAVRRREPMGTDVVPPASGESVRAGDRRADRRLDAEQRAERPHSTH